VKSVADTHFDTVYEKYSRYLCQYSKSWPKLLVAITISWY